MNKNILIAALACVISIFTCKAGTDTISAPDSVRGRGSSWQCFSSSATGQGIMAGVPLVAAGAVITAVDDKGRDLRQAWAPRFSTEADSYLRFAPAAVLAGMKLAGVESRSTWPQMLTADVFAVCIMGATVKGAKTIISRQRPDGSDCGSFPSGHTAAAFMCATMLDREYGARYPWLSVAGYGTASLTAYMRVANNRHWMGDVVAGAGIGILSTELGYMLGDLVWGRPVFGEAADSADLNRAPFSIGVYTSYDFADGSLLCPSGKTVTTGVGCTFGLSGEWYVTPRVGFAARATVSARNLIDADGATMLPSIKSNTYMAGLTVSQPFGARFSAELAAMAGYNRFRSVDVGDAEQIAAQGGVAYGAGVKLNMHVSRHLLYRAFFDADIYRDHRHRLAAGLQAAYQF